MNLKVGMINYGLDRMSGGIGRYTQELTEALRGSGVSLTILRAGRATSGHGVVGLPGAGLLPGLLSVGQLEIAWSSKRHQLDVVHDPTGAMPLLLCGTYRVATVHDVIPYVYPRTSSTLDLLIYRLWLPLVAARLDAIITVSKQSRSDIVQHLRVKPERVVVIPEAASARYHPVDWAQIQPVLNSHRIDAPYILYVGSIEPRKNLSRLLEAYAELRRWSTRWKLLVVGARRWKSSSVFKTVERLGLSPHVIFAGFVPEQDLPALYSGASLVAFPSLYEGFGLPVLEAMACGTPVVTSNNSSLPEVAGDAAILVDPYDVAALTEAMRQVLSDTDLAAELRTRGLAQVAQFTWDRTAREVIAVYEMVTRRVA